LVSDQDGAVKKLYGGGRISYLIDKKGIVRFIQEGVPVNQDFLDRIKQFNF
jgi:peroxiredoxin